MNNPKLHNLQEEQSNRRSIYTKITLLGIGISIAIVVCYPIFRLGFENIGLFDSIKSLALASIFLTPPIILFNKIKKYSIGGIYLLTTIFLFCISIITNFIGIDISIPITIIGIISLILFLRIYIKFFFKKKDLGYLFFIFAFAFFCAFLGLGSEFISPLFKEKTIIGAAFPDNAFFTTITSMSKTAFFPSTGLDGIPYIPYHWITYYIGGQFSHLINIDALVYINLTFLAVFFPLYFTSALFLAVELKKKKEINFRSGMLFFFIVITIMLPFFDFIRPILRFEPWMIVASPSSLTSTIFCFWVFSIARKNWSYMFSFSKKHIIHWHITFPLLIVLISLTKVSMIPPLFLLWGYAAIRTIKNKAIIALNSVLYIVVFVVTYKLFFHNSNSESILRLSDFQISIKTVLVNSISLFYLFFILIILFLYNNKTVSFKKMISQKRTLHIELAAIVIVNGVLIHYVFEFRNFAYFLIQPHWLLIPLVIYEIPDKIHIKHKRFQRIFSFFGYGYIVSLFLFNSINVSKKCLAINFNTRKQIYGESKNFKHIASTKEMLINLDKAKIALKENTQYELFNVFLEIKDKYANSNTCVFIKKSVSLLWKQNCYSPLGIPYYAVAITETPMIKGVAPSDISYYLYSQKKIYKTSKRFLDEHDLSDEEIKKVAAQNNYENIVIVEQDKKNKVFYRVLKTCLLQI